MKLLIADNDKAARLQLTSMVKKIPICREVGHAEDGMEAIYKSYRLKVDALLIELEIPKISGIEAIKHINKMENPPVSIVTTANAGGALDAYNVNVFSYLLKPIRENKLRDALGRACRYLKSRASNQRAGRVFDRAEKYHICCRQGKNMELIGIKDISHLHAENKYTFIHHQNGRITMSNQSLCFFTGEFYQWLLQIHRHTVINKLHLKGLKVNHQRHGFACLQGVDKLLPISRRNLPEVRRYLRSYSELDKMTDAGRMRKTS